MILPRTETLVASVVLILLLVSSVAAGPARAEARAPKAPGSKLSWYVVPNIAFDNDDGLGFGVRGELAVKEQGYTPYKTAYVMHIFATLRGYHHHRLRFDRTGLGPQRRARVTAHLAWRQWLNDGYWGIGNDTVLDREYLGSFADDDPRRKRYRYSLFQPFAHLTLRVALLRHVAVFAALNAKYSIIRSYPGSLLEEQQPFGMHGGMAIPLSAGVIYDSREPEVNPCQGIFAEISGRAAGDLPGNSGAFGGLFASFRGYISLTSFLVLASRIMGEWLFGAVPFYEMVHWGGSVPVTGFGGFETLRGVSFGRWRAPGKALLNVEARFEVYRHTLLGKPMAWQLAALFDAGTVFGAGDEAAAGTPATPVHPAWGLGIRAIYQGVFVGRVDTGIGLDHVREPDGSWTTIPTHGIYVVFDHAF